MLLATALALLVPQTAPEAPGQDVPVAEIVAPPAPRPPGKCEGSDNPQPWFVPGDYPASALQAGEEGVVGYVVDVDAEACVTGCTVTQSSGNKTLDDATCVILLRRARFSSAAEDASGNRVPATFRAHRWWVVPEPLPPGAAPPEPRGSPGSWVTNDDYPPAAIRAGEAGSLIFRLDLDASGRATGCAIRRSSGSAVLDLTACSLLVRRSRFQPARDAKGNPIPSAWANGFVWRLPAD